MGSEQRIVEASHGPWALMGYKFRCRVESRTRRTWFGFGREIKEFRRVLEYKHCSAWDDHSFGQWKTEDAASREAITILDRIESKPGDRENVHYI